MNGRSLKKLDAGKALISFKSASELAEKLKRMDLAAEAYFERAAILVQLDSLNAAINLYKHASLLFEHANFKSRACETLIILGNLQYERSKFPEALLFYKNALEITNSTSVSNYLIDINLGFGKVYTKQGNLTSALHCFVTALELAEKLNNHKGISDAGNQLGIAESLNNIGIIFKLEKDYKTASDFYTKSLEIRKKLNYKKGIGQSLFNIGSLKSETGAVLEALDFYRKSFEIKNELRDEYGKLSCYLNIGDAYQSLLNFNESEKNYNDGLLLAQRLGADDFHKSFHRQLSLLFAQQNKFEKAYYHHVRYMEIKDTLINTNNNSKLAELQAKYELSEKQRNIESLTNEKQLDRERYNREKYFRNSLIFIILLILIVAAVILNWGRLLKKKNKQLEISKKIIEQREQEKENLVREMHHRVKNNLQLTSSLLNLQARKVNDSEAALSLKQARDRIQAISLIHQKLYAKEDVTQINLQDYLPDLCNAVMVSNSNSKTKIELKYNLEPALFSVDMAISLGLIVNEILINSIKHAFKHTDAGSIEISAHIHNLEFVLTVKDNGCGIDGLNSNEEFGGFGFQLLRSFTAKLNGKMHVLNSQGTIVNINVPL